MRLSWVEPLPEGGHALRFSRLDDGRWSATRDIARGERWLAHWADVPALAALSDGTLAAAWPDSLGPQTQARGIRVALSSDGGASWSEPRWLHADESASEHGFVSLVPFGQDSFGAVWLDGRATAAGANGHEGAMQLRGRTVRRDGSRSFEQILDERVCDCCPTALARVEGRTLVAYRDRSDDEVRDIRLASTGAQGPRTRSVHDDGWRIDGCPVNGPALAVHGSLVAVAWYSEGSGEARVQVALSRDGGERFDAPRTLASGSSLGSVDAVFGPEGAVWVSWLEVLPQGDAAWMLGRVGPERGEPSTRRIVPARPDRTAGIARLAASGDALLFAWTEVSDDGSTRVRCARLETTR